MSRIVLSGIGDLAENAALDANPNLTLDSNDVSMSIEAAPPGAVNVAAAPPERGERARRELGGLALGAAGARLRRLELAVLRRRGGHQLREKPL